MPGNNKHITHFFLILVFATCSSLSTFAQIKTIHGIIKDDNSLKPISNVNIKINGTSEGVSTNEDGIFYLTLIKIPTSLTISCVGYEKLYYDIDKIPNNPLEFILRKSTYTLNEVNIKAIRYSFVFKSMNYSILDYEILDDNLLLLVFRCQLKNTELILLTRNGDTISINPLPEQKPKCFYRDFLGHVHYISTKGNAFQCVYNDILKKLEFPYRTTYDTLLRLVQSLLFIADDRLYFQEFTLDGFGKNIGYYDNQYHIQYIRTFSGETIRKKYYQDYMFNARWNNQLEAANAPNSALYSEDDRRADKLFHFKKINAPVVKLGEDEMAIFNFSEGFIEVMNKEGNVHRTVPIVFQKENNDNLLAGLFSVFLPIADWEWSGKIYIDEYYRDVYTTFKKNGMVQIRKIDLQTGKLITSFDIPFPFPEKIEIYKGEAYFLNKDIGGDFEKWKLVKLKL